jgi:hypothetical protein
LQRRPRSRGLQSVAKQERDHKGAASFSREGNGTISDGKVQDAGTQPVTCGSTSLDFASILKLERA